MLDSAILSEPANQAERLRERCTGREYLDSIANNGREVRLWGERIKDVTSPAFRNYARMVARFYDAMHEPEKSAKLLVPVDGGSSCPHAAYQAPRTAEDQIRTRDAIAVGVRITCGWMGPSPEFVGAYLGAFRVNTSLFGSAKKLCDRMRRKVPHFGHAIVNPSVDRLLRDQVSASVASSRAIITSPRAVLLHRARWLRRDLHDRIRS